MDHAVGGYSFSINFTHVLSHTVIITFGCFFNYEAHINGFARKTYWLIPVSFALTDLLIAGAISLKRNHMLLPTLAFAVFLVDFIQTAYIFISDLTNSDLNMMVICSGIIDMLVIALFSIYFSENVKYIRHGISE